MAKKESKTETIPEFKPVQIFIEEKMLDFELKTFKNLFDLVNVLSTELREEGIILTGKIFESFITEGYISIKKILVSEAEKNLKKLHISGTLVHESLSADALRIAMKFDRYSIPLKKLLYELHIPASEIRIDAGQASFAPGQEESVIQKWTCYVKDPKDKKLYDSLQAFITIARELDTYLKEEGYLPRLRDCLVSSLTENPFIPGEPGIPAELSGANYLMTEGENNDILCVNPKYFNQ
jgi:hypothetical protein